jgi:serine/threonine protein kinase
VIDKTKVPIGLVSEVMNVGSMDQLFSERAFSDEKNIFVFHLSQGLAEICHEIEALHDLDLIHGDIAARNILVTKVNDRYVFKLTDFGLIGDVKDKETIDQTKKMFPVYWSSPEASEGKSSKQSDIWSMGMTILEEYCIINHLDFIDIVSSHMKFEFTEKNLREVYKRNLIESPVDENGHVIYAKELLEKLNVGDKLKTILLKIFKKEPDNRVSLKEIAHDLESLEIVDYIYSRVTADKFTQSIIAHTKEQLKTDLNTKLPHFKEFWQPILETHQKILDEYDYFKNNIASFPGVRDSSTLEIENSLEVINNLIEQNVKSQSERDKYREAIRNTYPFINNFSEDEIDIDLNKNNELKGELNLQTLTTENNAKYIFDNMKYLEEVLGQMIASQPKEKSLPNKKLKDSKDPYAELNGPKKDNYTEPDFL